LEQIELQYGPDDRAIKLRGDARMSFGRQPRLDGVLSSIQIDLDRLLGLPDAGRRHPLAVIKALTDAFADAPPLPVPVRLGLSVETVTLAGAPLQRLSGDFKIDSGMLDIESLDLRVPGLTQVRLSGRLSAAPAGAVFAGPIKIETADPRGFAAWLADRSVAEAIAATPLRATGEIKLGSGAVTVDRLTAELDRTKLEGRLAYAWASEDRPARLDAAFTSRDVDLDRVIALGRGLVAGAGFERPGEGSLALKIARATFAGVEAKRADINVKLDSNGLDIERFAIGDFGGTSLAVTGRIDTRARAPRGAVALDLDARTLGGVAALAEKFAPAGAADTLRRAATRFAPAKLHASLSVDGDAAAPALAKFKLDGNAGKFRIDLQGDTSTADDAARKLALAGHVDAGDGGALVELIGLDRLVAVDKRPGRFTLSANGSLDGDVAVDGQLAAGGLDVSASGNLRLWGRQDANAGLSLKVTSANLRSPRPAAAGRAAETLPLALNARMVLADNTVNLTEISGKLADAPVSGRLRIATTEPPSVGGEIEIGALDLPASLAAALGIAPQPANANSNANFWPSEPFDAGLLGRLLGRVTVKSPRVTLTPKLAARDLRAQVTFDPAGLSIDDIDGTIAGGRVSGGLMFQRTGDAVTARSQLRLAGADVATLVGGDQPAGAAAPLSGGVTLDLAIDGSGRSPVALLGALRGSGSFVLQDGRLARLDPAAFDVVTRAADSGLQIDAAHIRDRMDTALSNGPLTVPLAEGAISIGEGQLRLLNTAVHAQGAELAVNAGVDLTEGTLDVRLVLSRSANAAAGTSTGSVPTAATPASVAGASGAPQVIIALKGPFAAPKRTLEANALASWLALRAVDQQSKRLDALQGGREAAVPPASGAGNGTAPNSATPAQTAPDAKPAAMPRRRPAQAVPFTDQLPPMPPPMDIRPAPGARPQRVPPARSMPVGPPAAAGASAASVGP
jgi:large subunit ribosomal protein L24